MRRSLTLAALLLFIASFGIALRAQNTPPGGDMVGSDRPVTRDDVRSSPTASPDANQRMTHSSGTSSGYENTPAFAGRSTDSTATAQQSPGRSGMQGQTSATAGRARAYKHARSSTSLQTTSRKRHAPARTRRQRRKLRQ